MSAIAIDMKEKKERKNDEKNIRVRVWYAIKIEHSFIVGSRV